MPNFQQMMGGKIRRIIRKELNESLEPMKAELALFEKTLAEQNQILNAMKMLYNQRVPHGQNKTLCSSIEQKLLSAGTPEKAAGMQRFFKTAPGEYGEGDQFIGLSSAQLRQFAKEHKALSLPELDELLRSPYHELRALALLVLLGQYGKGGTAEQKAIYDFYLKHSTYINNWDLVDISAPGIVGEYLLKHKRSILRKLSASSLLWEQRIAMVSTLTLIRNGEFEDTLELAELFFHHPHDLMHKACGWMLREIGKRERDTLTAFLIKHKSAMPRTMLRYAIEHYPEAERKAFLKK